MCSSIEEGKSRGKGVGSGRYLYIDIGVCFRELSFMVNGLS